MSIADLLYYWEISTVEMLLKREVITQQTDYLYKWYHETMKNTPEIAQIEEKSQERMKFYAKKGIEDKFKK